MNGQLNENRYIRDVKTQCDTLVIGAGMAGLIAAKRLSDAGRDVIVVDKGRGVGGRMATRRSAGARFDHGAQFISVRTERFDALMEEWIAAGIARHWSNGFADGLTGDGSLLTAGGGGAHMPARDGHPRYCARDGMTTIPKHLASGLDVRLGVTVSAIRTHEGGGWTIEADAGPTYHASSVVLTAPTPQALAIIARGEVPIEDAARDELASIDYAPCIALLAIAAQPVDLPAPGVLRQPNAALEWIADNTAKGISEEGPALTIHCGEDFSREYYENNDEDVYEEIRKRLPDPIPADFTFWQVKRWRYSRPKNPLSVGAWTRGLPPGLLLAGDAFNGARVEGAVLSGLAAADALLE